MRKPATPENTDKPVPAADDTEATTTEPKTDDPGDVEGHKFDQQ